MRRLIVDADLASVPLIGAGQDLHQRRLAGGIVTDQAEDLARHQPQLHVAQSLDGAEGLVAGAHLDDGDSVGRAHAVASVADGRNLSSFGSRCRMCSWRSQMSPSTATMRMMPIQTLTQCCGMTNDPAAVMICSDSSAR